MSKVTVASLVIVCAALALPNPARAEPKAVVTARCNDMGFSYYDYTFDVSYPVADLPPGTVVELIHGYAGHGSVDSRPETDVLSWENLAIAIFDASGHAQAKLYYMATGGYFSDFDFAVRVTYPAEPAPSGDPDEAKPRIVWDNGGTHESYLPDHYRANFFVPGARECWHLQNAHRLDITAVSEPETR